MRYVVLATLFVTASACGANDVSETHLASALALPRSSRQVSSRARAALGPAIWPDGHRPTREVAAPVLDGGAIPDSGALSRDEAGTTPDGGAFYTLTLRVIGSGRVWTWDRSVECRNVCQLRVAAGQEVWIARAADLGWHLDGFSGDCYPMTHFLGAELRMRRDAECVVTFTSTPMAVAVRLEGNGSGRVVSDPPGIDCGSACAAGFPAGSRMVLRAMAEPGSTFRGFRPDNFMVHDCGTGGSESTLLVPSGGYGLSCRANFTTP